MAVVTAGHQVFISIGSNLGDKLDNCLKGIAALTESAASAILGVSRFYRTSPVDYVDQDWFVNAAVKIATAEPPLILLDRLAAIQQRMGRKEDGVRFGPRVLDLDILLVDAMVMRSARLEIPHPRMHKRVFVLRPLCDIDPSIIHPVLGKTVAELLRGLDDRDQQVVPLDDQPALTQGRWP